RSPYTTLFRSAPAVIAPSRAARDDVALARCSRRLDDLGGMRTSSKFHATAPAAIGGVARCLLRIAWGIDHSEPITHGVGSLCRPSTAAPVHRLAALRSPTPRADDIKNGKTSAVLQPADRDRSDAAERREPRRSEDRRV